MTNLYAVKDVKSSYWSPMAVVNDAIAIRDFSGFVNHPDTAHIAKDLELWRLGMYDELTGIIVSDIGFVCAYRDVAEVKSNLVEFPVKKEDVNECE